MRTYKKILAGASLALAVGAAIVVPAVAAPASTSDLAGARVCHTWTETYTKPGCDKKTQICTAYIYHRICD